MLIKKLKRGITRWLESCWYQDNPTQNILIPLEQLFKLIVKLRTFAYQTGLKKRNNFSCPVIVVGNLTVGGTGKTPLVIWIAKFLISNGFKPGVISRGYGGIATTWPQRVTSNTDPGIVGDEAVVIARTVACPIAVGPSRVENARLLMQSGDCNILISDDGLQHYALGRNIEISVVDGTRRYGNGRCLPAGPLREPLSRLDKVDLIVCNGIGLDQEFTMQLEGDLAVNLKDPTHRVELTTLSETPMHAVAAIGNPQRFFNHLQEFNLKITNTTFPDHHRYDERDFAFDDSLPILMTEKDAVKCTLFAKANYWYVPVQADLDVFFGEQLLTLIEERKIG